MARKPKPGEPLDITDYMTKAKQALRRIGKWWPKEHCYVLGRMLISEGDEILARGDDACIFPYLGEEGEDVLAALEARELAQELAKQRPVDADEQRVLDMRQTIRELLGQPPMTGLDPSGEVVEKLHKFFYGQSIAYSVSKARELVSELREAYRKQHGSIR